MALNRVSPITHRKLIVSNLIVETVVQKTEKKTQEMLGMFGFAIAAIFGFKRTKSSVSLVRYVRLSNILHVWSEMSERFGMVGLARFGMFG